MDGESSEARIPPEDNSDRSALLSGLPDVALARLLRLVTRLVVREPDAELVELLDRPDVRMVMTALAPGLPAWLDPRVAALKAGDPAALAELLEADAEAFAALFLLPEGCRPLAGAWTDRAEAVAASAHQTLGRLGRERDGPMGRLPLDHLGLHTELAAEQLESSDPELRQGARELARRDLGDWAGAFGGRVLVAETTPLNKALGALVAALFPMPPKPVDPAEVQHL